MQIPRGFYVDKLVSRMHNGAAKIITGVRRCGKSYLLFELFREHLLESGVPLENIIEVKLDDWANRALRNPSACYDYVKSRVDGASGMCYVMLDEVQLMADFEEVVSGFLHFGNVDVYVTGSNSKFLSTDVITEFRGRGDEVRLHPLTFAEFFAERGGDWESAWRDYSTYGGMPRVALMAREEDKIDYLERLFAETYIRDIVERNDVRRPEVLEDVIDVVASAVGSLTSPSRLANTFRSAQGLDVSPAIVGRYLSYLEEAFLVTKVRRYDVRGRKFIGSPCKYYFEDIGLRNARLKFRQQEPTHIMENIVYNELVQRGYAVDFGVVELRKTANGVRSATRTEIDFVANLGSKRYYVQSAYALPTADKRAQEVQPLNGVGDSFKKIVVVRENVMPCRDEQGILTIGLKDFLLKPDSLDL